MAEKWLRRWAAMHLTVLTLSTTTTTTTTRQRESEGAKQIDGEELSVVLKKRGRPYRSR